MESQKVYVVASHDPESHHPPTIIGVYSTEEKAHNKILSLLKQEFNGMNKNYIKLLINGEGNESDSEYETGGDERFAELDPNKTTWSDIEAVFREELAYGETRGFDMDHYICRGRTVDK